MSFTVDMRVDAGRCVVCSQLTDAYFCEECGIDSLYNVRPDDRRAPTATQVSRGRQRLVDAGAAYDQLIDMQTIPDAGVVPVDQERSSSAAKGLSMSGRARRLRMIRERENGGFGHIPMVSGIPRGCFNSPLKRGSKRWNSWIRFWSWFGFQLVDDLTRPEEQSHGE